MTKEAKLSLITISALLGPLLFAYFTYSASKWVSKVEIMTEKIPVIEERVLRQDQGIVRIEKKLDLIINKLANI